MSLAKNVSALRKRIFVYGAGGHAKVVAEILRLNGHEVTGFIDNVNPERKGEAFYGATILGGEEVLEELLHQGVHSFIVGYGDNRLRCKTSHRLVEMGFTLVSALHPNAVCAADVSIGEGTVVASGAVVGPSSRIGRNAIVNTQASLDHDCVVGDGAHVGPGVIVTGVVEVGERVWIGAGAVIADHKIIAADAIVGAGAVVVKDVPEAVIVMGVPARIARPVKR
jgi:sugar O-acyltransferase (sialic acid O-acetyltransferase NeuD family)